MTRALSLLLVVIVAHAHCGCATVVGTLTGAETGLVDAPAQAYRNNSKKFDDHPEYWAFNVLIVAPLGFAFGTVAGLVKGVAADVRCLTGKTELHDVWGTYGGPSIWRPYSFSFEVDEGQGAR